MSELKFHPKAFSLVWEMPRLTPREHMSILRRLLTEWEKEKKAMGRKNGGSKKC